MATIPRSAKQYETRGPREDHDDVRGHDGRCNVYTRLAKAVSRFCGRPGVFTFAVAAIVAWAVSGPLFGFSDTWQLWINTSTTIITFLMVFLIQNTQNRDTEAIQVKLDELIRATRGARNELMDMEELSEEELEAFRRKFVELAETERQRREHREGKPAGTRPVKSLR
jgi:low affinity Fe/Cu permease